MNREQRKTELTAFLKTICRPGVSLNDSDENDGLVAAGLIDSLATLEIISFLEQDYGISFQDPDVDPNELGSIAGILDLLERKTS
jgi:acyl carrier protein